jgi:hypothetical protein
LAVLVRGYQPEQQRPWLPDSSARNKGVDTWTNSWLYPGVEERSGNNGLGFAEKAAVWSAARSGRQTLVRQRQGNVALTGAPAASVRVQSTTSRCAWLPPICHRSKRTGSSNSTG